ncbi:MAG: hypothetical protein HY811_10030 [Planctomycetes bacterium]|nr:hypothetical protein [Planctomycetota bacterium]
MNYYDFLSSIARGKLPARPVFMFSGTEDFLKDKGIEAIKSLYPDMDIASFFRQENYTSANLLTELCALPFFAKKKLVVLELSGDPKFREEVKTTLDTYLKQPSGYIILIIKTNTALNLPEKTVLQIECQSIPDYELPKWIILQVSGYGKSMARSTAKLISEYTGNNLTLIDDTLKKIILFAGTRATIEENDILGLVDSGIEGDIKKLVSHIRNGQTESALAELDRLLALGESSERIIGFLGWHYKTNPSKNQKDKIAKLIQTDKVIKTSVMPDDLALKTLIVNLI